jgi:hypothetical protein
MDADGSGSTGVIILYGVNSFANLLANCKCSISNSGCRCLETFLCGAGLGACDQTLGCGEMPKLIYGTCSREHGLQERPAEPEREDTKASGQALIGWRGRV